MRVLVCGGRDYARTEQQALAMMSALASLHREHRFSEVIEGGAGGADSRAREFAEYACIPVRTFKADWLRNGRASGPIRNHRMIDEGKPDLVIAFPGGRGTADMVMRAKRAGIPVQQVG